MTNVTDQIARHRSFSNLNEGDRAALAACLRSKTVRGGEMLFREGEFGDCMYFIEQGAVRVLGREKSKAQRALAELGPGDVLGEMSCIDPAARSATALALKDTTALVLTRDGLHALRAYCPTPAQAVFGVVSRALAQRLGDTHALIVERIGAPARTPSGVIRRHEPAPASVPAPAPAPVSASGSASKAVSSRVGQWFRRGDS